MTTIPAPPSRNDPCPCGSGKRYKHCHGSGSAVVPMPVPMPAPAAPAALDAAGDPISAARDAIRAGDLERAAAVVERRFGREPDDLGALKLLAEAVRESDPARSRACWERARRAAPGDPEPLFFLGDFCRASGDFAGAIDLFEQALALAPDHPALLTNLGLALEQRGDLPAAERCHARALEISPDDPGAIANLAQIHYQQRRYKEAIPLFRRLARELPDAPAAILANLGVSLRCTGDPAAAEPYLVRATELAPDSPGPWRDLGICRAETDQWGGAALALARAIELDPTDQHSASLLLHARGHECIWDGFDALRRSIVDAVDRPPPGIGHVVSPFSFQAINDDPALERAAAMRHAALEFLAPRATRPARRPASGKLRVGFLSPDLNGHPVGRLVVGLIERLDRARFEVHAYDCNGPQVDGVWRRIRAASDRFRSVRVVDAREVADAIRADGIDVLIDLTGFTGGSNLSILALRPAPVQINYLGYTGTLGSAAVDWIVADAYCIPPGLADTCVERPLRVEPCYMPPCDDRAGDVAVARSGYGLPDDAVVYAAMSAPYKILPERFDAWMAILRAVPDSVLWMRTIGTVAVRRVLNRAESRGVDPRRLRFASNEDLPRYLARFGLADLFLDTSPFGSHTTVNDALSAGLPVLTQAGRTFASRASASQVIAAGLPELATASLQEYVDAAVALGRDRPRLRESSLRLRANRSLKPFFDADAYARAFEAAVERAWAETPAG